MNSSKAEAKQTSLLNWLLTPRGQRAGHILWILSLVAWVIVAGRRNGGHFAYAFGAVLGYSFMIGIGCYVVAIAKPLDNRNLHAGIFGIVLTVIAIYQWVR
jgi:hypothetical protein